MFCKVDKIVELSIAYGFKLIDFICCCYVVCPVPMNKEEEKFIKGRERNRELMEEIAREIQITCLGKLKMTKKKIGTIIKTLDEQVLPRELHVLLNS